MSPTESTSRGVLPMTRRAFRANPGKDLVALGFIAGLAAWYAGGSSALDRMLDTGPLLRAVAIMTVVAAILVGACERVRGSSLKEALTEAALTAAVCALLGSTLGALVNRHADSTEWRREEALLTGFKSPSKGPRVASFEFISRVPRHFTLQASCAAGCTEGARAELEVRRGFFGMPWVARVSCPR